MQSLKLEIVVADRKAVLELLQEMLEDLKDDPCTMGSYGRGKGLGGSFLIKEVAAPPIPPDPFEMVEYRDFTA